ncbi:MULTISPECIES: class I adenylate-forming enzyme family protein [unclassified Pseudonocardia]|uniref:class I adenylate-forming enzyme family protein n=1 Tax=unclassified Pseudonocardia TaxID=2619320 RepID=UPI0001FFDE0C|nr:class I adenylate-forming enzyme family protein [Pseudonocardia sp. Ae707_Ps1]OLM08922.1 O-succinylbenzoic acid--CoA ligase [Pseudonocardia sp. Ae707_Ps1]
MNVLTSIERIARQRGDHVAVRSGGQELQYRDLIDTAARFAGYLHRAGLQPGDRVGIYLHNEPEWIPALLGIWRAGGVAVPFNYMFAPSPLRHAAVDSGARWIIALGADVPRLQEVLADTPLVRGIITLTPADGATVSFGEATAGEPLRHTVPRLDGDDALLMYTSGSTGRPKGVRQTHRNTTAECEAVIDVFDLGSSDSALVCTPLFHVGGLQLITLPLLLAGGQVTLRRWNAAEYVNEVLTSRPTVLAIVPAMMIDIVSLLKEQARDFESVRVCMVGGSAMPESRLKQFSALTGVVPVNIYGQTEQSGLAITERTEQDRRTGSLGRPLEQILQWQVVPVGADEPLPAGADLPGELWVRGDAVTPGYWQLPETNDTKFRDGWFRTTDLVREAPDGFLYYVERADDMIISGGENIYPQMVEGHLLACPMVAEVAVIGTPHERFVEQVTAIIVPTRPDVTAEDIAEYCQTQPDLRGLQRPRRIEIVDTIPRTGTNKIDKPALKVRFRD